MEWQKGGSTAPVAVKAFSESGHALPPPAKEPA